MNRNNILRTLAEMTVFLLLSCPAMADKEYFHVAQNIAQQGRNNVRFTDEMMAFYLDEPLLSKGVMRFDPPDKLTKIIEEPEYIKQQISGDEVLVIRGDNEPERFSLASHLGLEVMANTLRSLLSGEFDYIQNEYDIEFQERAQTWSMKLVPLKENVEEIVESVVVEGRGGIITKYTITESNGDYTITSLYDADH